MAINDKYRKSYRIFLKATREWVNVSEEYYRDHARFCNTWRKRHQEHGRCCCKKEQFWLCDTDCLTCEFCRAGDQLSLEYEMGNKDGDTYSFLDTLQRMEPTVDEIICDKAELEMLIDRLNELMPEAIWIGKLRLEGLSDSVIAEQIDIKRTTFLSRLKKVKKQLIAEFPHLF